MTRPLTAYAHLPLVRLESKGALPVGEGDIVELTFDEWAEMDLDFLDTRRQFERVRPAFYREHHPTVDGPTKAFFGEFDRRVTVTYRALLLTTYARLPSPHFSTRYFYAEADRKTQRVIGPFEREYILYRDEPLVLLGAEIVKRVGAAMSLLTDATVSSDEDLRGAFDALERTARPDFYPLNAFVHSMVALESLLLPDVRRELKSTFARRGAFLIAEDAGDLDGARAWLRNLYDVRSAALHGERTPYDPSLFALGRLTHAQVILHAAAWCRATGDSVASLRLALDSLRDEGFTTFRENYPSQLR